MDLRLRLQWYARSMLDKHDDPDPAAMRLLQQNLRGLIHDATALNAKVAIATYPHVLDEQGQPGVFNSE